MICCLCVFFFKQRTAYEMRISDWSSDVCSSDLVEQQRVDVARLQLHRAGAFGLDVAAPRGHALVPVVGRLLVGLLDQQQRRVGARERTPLPVAILESRALVELDGAAADAQRVLPAVDRKSVVWGKSVSVR